MTTGTSFQVRELLLLANCDASGSDQTLLCEAQWGPVCLCPRRGVTEMRKRRLPGSSGGWLCLHAWAMQRWNPSPFGNDRTRSHLGAEKQGRGQTSQPQASACEVGLWWSRLCELAFDHKQEELLTPGVHLCPPAKWSGWRRRLGRWRHWRLPSDR